MKFKEYIREIRLKDNLTQNNLAEILGISLAAIKKIEAGNTEYPSTKVLEALAGYLKKSEVEIIRELLFDKETINKYEDDEAPAVATLQKYIALMFINGWNIASYLPFIEMEKLDDEHFGAELTSKRVPTYNMLIDSIYKYAYWAMNVDDERDAWAIFNTILVTVIRIKPKIKEYAIIFDMNNEDEAKLYNNIKLYSIRNLKVKVKIVLFDSAECKIVHEKEVCID